ncbi:4-alpha-glucanotransferase, partial [Myxococcota bacterium]|nr:4-alpha-glucanotransferase [Myxococcota bacterium]
ESVVYTATHDNDTTRSWWNALPDWERDRARRYLQSSDEDIVHNLVRAAFASVADTVIIPLQDVLQLGSDARMNRPASIAGNWTWRVREEALNPEMAGKLRELVELYGQ